eukprot:scaffold163506_cov71-Attheya_sp.AAC.1
MKVFEYTSDVVSQGLLHETLGSVTQTLGNFFSEEPPCVLFLRGEWTNQGHNKRTSRGSQHISLAHHTIPANHLNEKEIIVKQQRNARLSTMRMRERRRCKW